MVSKETSVISLAAIVGALVGISSITSLQAQESLWGALASGIDRYGSTTRVSIGSAIGHPSEFSAHAAALRQCRRRGNSNCRVVSTFTGCGYITLSTSGSSPVAWGSGPTSQRAYNNCYDRVRVGNCVLPALGGCN